MGNTYVSAIRRPNKKVFFNLEPVDKNVEFGNDSLVKTLLWFSKNSKFRNVAEFRYLVTLAT